MEMFKTDKRLALRFLAGAIVVVCVLFSTYWIYHNLKKDIGIDGQGRVVLTEDCKHVGPWDEDYECKGTYQQGSGMVSVPDAVVHVTGQHFKGESVADIYRSQAVGADAPAFRQHYISGEDRRSLLHNLSAVVVIFSGLALLGWLVWPKRT